MVLTFSRVWHSSRGWMMTTLKVLGSVPLHCLKSKRFQPDDCAKNLWLCTSLFTICYDFIRSITLFGLLHLIPVHPLPPVDEPWNSSGVGFFRDFRGRVKKA